MEYTFESPWYAVCDIEEAAQLFRQLQVELSADHPLVGLPVIAIARRSDTDDVLFCFEDGSSRVAEVHLTWQGKQSPPFPWASIYSDLESWSSDINT